MYPVIFRIGNLAIHSYGLMIALAVLVVTVALYREAPKEKMNPDHLLEAVIVATLAGLIGSRLLYVMLNWSYFSRRPLEILFAQFAGLSFYGALFGGVIVLYLWSRWRKIGFLAICDILAPYLALGYAFGRIGCFLNGCCYGKESSLPWALPAYPGDVILRHPVQLYAAIGAVAVFIVLKKLRAKKPFDGSILLSLFALYGLLRFATEFFRYGEAAWLGLTTAQLFSLALLLVSITAIYAVTAILKQQKKRERPKISKKHKKSKGSKK